jgi:hypothetical protein
VFNIKASYTEKSLGLNSIKSGLWVIVEGTQCRSSVQHFNQQKEKIRNGSLDSLLHFQEFSNMRLKIQVGKLVLPKKTGTEGFNLRSPPPLLVF